MASMVAKGSSTSGCSRVSPFVSVQEKGSRNKRKFRADPPLGETNRIISSTKNEFPSYEFSSEKFAVTTGYVQPTCDMCGVNHDQSDGLKLDLGLSTSVASSDVGSSQPREELECDEFEDADWNNPTEGELEELVLGNLDSVFKGAIKKIIACGFSEEIVTKAVLRSGLCYGCKDIESNIVDNTLTFLRSGQQVDHLRAYCFENLLQLEKYILEELISIVKGIRPFYSTGDAMWWLLVSDMNVSHACAIDSDVLGSLLSEGNSNEGPLVGTPPHMKTETKNTELDLPNSCKPVAFSGCSNCTSSEANLIAGSSSTTNLQNSLVFSGQVSEEQRKNSKSDALDKPFGVRRTAHAPASVEKFISSRKSHSSHPKREMLRQKSLHLEKSHRTYGSKGSSRSGKLSGLSGLLLDKKSKSLSDSSAVNLKNASTRTCKAIETDLPQHDGKQNPPVQTGPYSPVAFHPETALAVPELPKTNIASSSSVIKALESPVIPTSPALLTANTDLSLSLPTASNSGTMSANCNNDSCNCSFAGFLYDKSQGQWPAQDKKDETVLKLVPRVRELQNQLQEWTEWANQKVMQAARRLTKDKAELKALRQEKEEVERLRKEKQALEESTMKKLAEMENALSKASGQVERANTAVRRLEIENASLRQEMEAAKFRASESAASCQEVAKREKKTLMKFQSWEREKTMLQEELTAERRKVAHFVQELEQAKVLEEQIEARWKQEEKETEKLLTQTSSIRKEREQIEDSTRSKEDMIKSKAERNLQRYKDGIQRLEREISKLRLKTDSSRIAALRQGIDGSYASKLTDAKNDIAGKDFSSPFVSVAAELWDNSKAGGVKRERECVMCLSEEMSVVFLPCAHQVVCNTCNELHEKQGMKDCPSCRSPIKRRISVCFART